MTLLTFQINGKPIPQERARVTKNGTYYPKKCKDYSLKVQKKAMDAVVATANPIFPLRMPLALNVIICRIPPKRLSKKNTRNALNGMIAPTTTPDTDNYLKLIKDAMNGIVYVDDSYVCTETITKRYGSEEGVTVMLYGMAAKAVQDV